MILTNIALAGYNNNSSSNNSNSSNCNAHNNNTNNINTPLRTSSLASSSLMSPLDHPNQITKDYSNQFKTNTFVTFPLPKSNNIGVLSVNNDNNNNSSTNNANSTISSLNDSTNQHKNIITSQSSIKVISIQFARAEEVELLWLESCKAFADLTNILPLEITKRSIFCLQSIFLSAEISGLPDELWLKSIQELVNRLPISLPIAYQRLISGNDSEIIECCLRSCNIIFEMIITYKKKLGLFNEFPTFWLRFISALATNTNMVSRGLPLHDEMLEMITALLRLLPNPAKSSISITSPINTSNTSASQTLPQSSTLWSYIATPFFGNNSNKVLDTPNQTTNPPSTPPPITQLNKNSPVDINQNIQLSPLGSVTGSVESDAALLKLSWNTICSLCPSLQATLKLKNPKLVADLVKLIQLSDITQHPSIKTTSVSGNNINNNNNNKINSQQKQQSVSQELTHPDFQITQVANNISQLNEPSVIPVFPSIIAESNKQNPTLDKISNDLNMDATSVCIESTTKLNDSKIILNNCNNNFLAPTRMRSAKLLPSQNKINSDNNYYVNSSLTVSSATSSPMPSSISQPQSPSLSNQLESSIAKPSIVSSLPSQIGTQSTTNLSPEIVKSPSVRSANMRKLDSRTQVV
jgi:hypothetical protein